MCYKRYKRWLKFVIPRSCWREWIGDEYQYCQRIRAPLLAVGGGGKGLLHRRRYLLAVLLADVDQIRKRVAAVRVEFAAQIAVPDYLPASVHFRSNLATLQRALCHRSP